MPELSDQQLGIVLIALRRLQDDIKNGRHTGLANQCEDYGVLTPPLEEIDNLCETINCQLL